MKMVDFTIWPRRFKVEPVVHVKLYYHEDGIYYELSPGDTYHELQKTSHGFCAVCETTIENNDDCKVVADVEQCKELYQCYLDEDSKIAKLLKRWESNNDD